MTFCMGYFLGPFWSPVISTVGRKYLQDWWWSSTGGDSNTVLSFPKLCWQSLWPIPGPRKKIFNPVSFLFHQLNLAINWLISGTGFVHSNLEKRPLVIPQWQSSACLYSRGHSRSWQFFSKLWEYFEKKLYPFLLRNNCQDTMECLWTLF